MAWDGSTERFGPARSRLSMASRCAAPGLVPVRRACIGFRPGRRQQPGVGSAQNGRPFQRDQGHSPVHGSAELSGAVSRIERDPSSGMTKLIPPHPASQNRVRGGRDHFKAQQRSLAPLVGGNRTIIQCVAESRLRRQAPIGPSGEGVTRELRGLPSSCRPSPEDSEEGPQALQAGPGISPTVRGIVLNFQTLHDRTRVAAHPWEMFS